MDRIPIGNEVREVGPDSNLEAGNPGEKLLLEGQQLREQGRTLEAIDSLNRAINEFAIQHDHARFAHAILDRAICYQHLYQFTGNDFGYAVLYRKDAEAMLTIVEAENIEVERDQAYFMNAKASSIFADYPSAIGFFTRAIESMPEARAAQKGDWRTNLGKALYLNGEKDRGVAEILEGIEQVKQHAQDVDAYTSNVWISGGYLRLAELLREDSPQKSEGYLEEAKKIVENDPQQVVRKKQIENFESSGKTGL